MTHLLRFGLLLTLLRPSVLMAQSDSIRLICPLNEATLVPPPKNALQLDEPDLCVVLVSLPDTVVKSVAGGRITNVEYDDETRNGVVLFARLNGKDYYFWFTGMNNLLVHKNQVVKAGQPLGTILPGEKIEINMYQFETPVNPVHYLDCKYVLRRE